jgi:hypothetical protein
MPRLAAVMLDAGWPDGLLVDGWGREVVGLGVGFTGCVEVDAEGDGAGGLDVATAVGAGDANGFVRPTCADELVARGITTLRVTTPIAATMAAIRVRRRRFIGGDSGGWPKGRIRQT